MFEENSPPPASPPSSPPPDPMNAPLPTTAEEAAPPPAEYGADLSPATTPVGPSAVEAGKIKPKIDLSSGSLPPTGEITEPSSVSRVLLALAIVVVLALIGFGVWWFIMREDGIAVPTLSDTTPTPTTEPAITPATPSDFVEIDVAGPPTTTTPATTTPVVLTPTVPGNIPVVATEENKDSDSDGLTDAKELELGTNPNNPDSDADGLTDGAELNIWGTEPLQVDSDGDTYPDGQEVYNGYNPKGPGKLK